MQQIVLLARRKADGLAPDSQRAAIDLDEFTAEHVPDPRVDGARAERGPNHEPEDEKGGRRAARAFAGERRATEEGIGEEDLPSGPSA